MLGADSCELMFYLLIALVICIRTATRSFILFYVLFIMLTTFTYFDNKYTCKFALNLFAEGSICRTNNTNDFSRTALTHTVLRIVLVIGTNFTWKNAFDIYSDIYGLSIPSFYYCCIFGVMRYILFSGYIY